MEFLDIKSLHSHIEEKVSIRGWIHKIQTFPKHSFIVLRDGVDKENKVQIFVMKNILPENLTVESYILVTGTVQKLPKDKYSYQSFEICAGKIDILSLAQNDFSSRCPDGAGIEIQLGQRHLYLRNDNFAIITKLRSIFLKSIRSYFDDSDCTEIVPPCFVGNQCEGGSSLFKVDHVGQPAYLTQSSQFYLEYALPSVGDCYCIYPSFRAENSQTRRHLTEFLHAEAEWRNVFTMDDHVKKLKDMMIGILVNFIEWGGDLLEQLGRYTEVTKCFKMVRGSIIMTHREAIEYCRENNIYKDEESKSHFFITDDIPEAQERKMIDQIGKVVFLVKFPRHFKSFYMKSCEDDPEYVEGCDVEVPNVGEIIGSGIRVSDPDELIKRLKNEGLKEEEYVEYIDMRRYGHGQTSGMGLGVDRMLTWLLGTHSIRDVVTFPRYPGRLFP
jgi:asparaginyl-tRNA synthetase